MSEPDLIETLEAATADLVAGDLDAVIERVERLPRRGGLVGVSLLETARALKDEQGGRMSTAMQRIERVTALDVAIPAVLLEAARFYHRHGQAALAERALLLRDVIVPDDPPSRDDLRAAHEVPRYATLFLRSHLREGRRMTYPAAPLKGSLVRRLGPDGAAVVLAGMSDGKVVRRAARSAIVPLIEHARDVGLDHRELIPAGSALSQPPPVSGRQRADEVEAPVRSFFTSVLEDVVVSSMSNVLFTRGAALLDVQGDELAQDPDLGVDPVVVARDGTELVTTVPADPGSLPSVPEAIWLTGVHSGAFGHWMIEFLPKVWAFADHPDLDRTPVLVDDGMPPQHLEALRLFTSPEQPIVVVGQHEAVHVGRLWVASMLHYLAVGPRPEPPGSAAIHDQLETLDRDRFRELVGHAHAAIDGLVETGSNGREGAASPKRIYLTRKADQLRRLANAEAVDARIVARGFVPYDFGDLTFREQLQLIRGAKHVIGQNGSAMLMTLLARPGLRIGGLAQPRLDEWQWYTDACVALGQTLEIIVGRVVKAHPAYPWMSDYEIDLDELDAYLESTVRDEVGATSD